MLDPMKKGALSFHSSVDIRGYQRVNVLAAIYLIMYGKEQEEKFAKADIKKAGTLWSNMFMKNIQPVVQRKDAIREVYATLLQQSERAKTAFEEMEVVECSDAELAEVLTELKNGNPTVPAIEEVVEKAEVVEEPEVTVETELEGTVEECTVKVSETSEKKEWVEPVIEEVDPVTVEEPTVESTTEGNSLADIAESISEGDGTEEPLQNESAVVTEEPAKVEAMESPSDEVEAKPMYNEDLVVVEEQNKYRQALSGKLKDEVRDFKTLSNAYTATKLCNKIVKLVPGEPLLDLMYNKEVVHILYEEFEGAAYLLSSFRVLAVGIATGGNNNA